MPASCSSLSARRLGPRGSTAWWPATPAASSWRARTPTKNNTSGRSTGRRTTWRPASRACSRSATCGPSRPSGSPQRWERARWPSCSCTGTWKRCYLETLETAGGTMAVIAQCNPEELRSLFLFQQLTDDQLARLCQEDNVEIIESGQVFAEGDPAACLYVLIEGEIVTSRRVSGDDVQVSRTDQRGVYSGAFTAYLGDRVPQIYQNSLRVTMPSRFYVMGAECFSQIMNEWFPMPVHLLEGLFIGGQRTREAIGQRERLLALGSLTAGLTHELNNPAAAAVSATSALRERVAGMRSKLKMLAKGKYPAASWEALVDLQQRAVERVAKAPKLDPIETSD